MRDQLIIMSDKEKSVLLSADYYKNQQSRVAIKCTHVVRTTDPIICNPTCCSSGPAANWLGNVEQEYLVDPF